MSTPQQLSPPALKPIHRRRGSILTKLQSTSKATRFSFSDSTTKHSGEATRIKLLERVRVGAPERESVKIRVVTFNAFESLIEEDGDFSELLGTLPEGYDIELESQSTSLLPDFKLNSFHPYHLIVFCAQECPGKLQFNSSGMGMGALLEEKLCQNKEEAIEMNEDENVKEVNKIKGMYVLASKERLLPGLFLAMFVHKDCQSLIQGISSTTVTAGLLNGRLGNKGGIAVSLMFFNQRFLFVNVHLAAHSNAVEKRKEDMKKIFDGLKELNDFSGKGGRELIPVVERWDQVFVMGDMNFRLDLSRNHADWLMAKKDYSTALEFDQLRRVMKETDSVFKSFQEAIITFAPTYKYDVVKKPPRPMLSRSSSSRPSTSNSTTTQMPKLKSNDKTFGNSSSTSLASMTSSLELESLHAPASPTTKSSKQSNLRSSFSFRLDDESPLPPLPPPNLKISDGTDSDSVSISSVDSNSSNLSDYENPEILQLTVPLAKRGKRATLDLVKFKIITKFKKQRSSELEFEETEKDEKSDTSVFDTGSKKRVQSYCDRVIYSTSQRAVPESESKVKFGRMMARSSSNKSNQSTTTEDLTRVHSRATSEKGNSTHFWSSLGMGLVGASTEESRRRRSSEAPIGITNLISKREATKGVLRSFFHLPSFLSYAPSQSQPLSTPPSELPPPIVVRTGPKFGEIEPIEYNAIFNMTKLKAISDHRPVYLVVAVGVEEE